jgi:hypothetical protein
VRIADCVQGTKEWREIRRGVPSATGADKILTAGGKEPYSKDGKPAYKASASQGPYLVELLAEFFLGLPPEEPKTLPMLRGNVLEAEAVAWYEFNREIEVQRVGFCFEDGERYGCSPDALIGEDGIGEFKCPTWPIHVKYMLGIDSPAIEYRPQLQFQLLVTGRQWVDIVSYHPEAPKLVIRVERDEKYIAELSKQMDQFCLQLALHKQRMIEQGFVPYKPPVFDDRFGITEEDGERIIAATFGRTAAQGEP